MWYIAFNIFVDSRNCSEFTFLVRSTFLEVITSKFKLNVRCGVAQGTIRGGSEDTVRRYKYRAILRKHRNFYCNSSIYSNNYQLFSDTS